MALKLVCVNCGWDAERCLAKVMLTEVGTPHRACCDDCRHQTKEVE